MTDSEKPLYLALISIHGLIRGHNLELGRDADTGGQTLYVLELAQALAARDDVDRVDLITRRVVDPAVDADYAEPLEEVSAKLRIIRITAGPDAYLPKEQLWDHLPIFVDQLSDYFRDQERWPDLFHSHYADAGWVGARLAQLTGIPLIHTGHSLGRVKRRRLLAAGLSREDIEHRYNMARRIEAEEVTLATAERVITSTQQEIEEQYELYDYYQPKQMRVVPPGTNLELFTAPTGKEFDLPQFALLTRHLKNPRQPIIFALSRPDKRKNITKLVEAYGQSKRLQDLANLVIIAGNREDIDDLDEGARDLFYEVLATIDRYDLYGKVAIPKQHRRADVPFFYRIVAASKGIFVNPALTEPFGLTLIEAAASGLPIVATRDGGPRDIIGNCDNGFLIDPLDPQEIAGKLQQLLEDEDLWQSFSQKGLKGVREHYSWQAHADRYLHMVTPVIKRYEPLEREPLSRRDALYSDRALVSGLDQNLIGDASALKELMSRLRRQRKSTAFIIATGRRLDSALALMNKHAIPEPDILITSGGSEIYYAPELEQDQVWAKYIDFQWSPHKVREVLTDYPGLKRQAKIEQSRFKVSYYIDPTMADVDKIQRLLHQEGLAVNAIMSFGQFLDILPARASKGLALRYVADRRGIELERVLAAGGAGADEDMLSGTTLAVVVANRHHEELSGLVDTERIYFARQPLAAGILEAMDYYDFFGACRDPREQTNGNA
ncbi:HAD family hydrolase [Pelovirga terrestris]|uniref:sucrose-phosphate synthase n=1 Tax=Pelovirga terrestris TaxID=2771352 RepID=A0A8J6QWI9_9BACT|nr:HAD family hydrolase [Pelovirga terrestris]MBD1399906.1 glycosyltransferase [Pelovirga terrestris]